MQHPEEAAAEAKAEGDGAFRFIGEGSVVELELFERVAQVGVLGAVLGVYAAEDHRPCGAVAGQRLGGRLPGVGDGVAHVRVGDILYARREIADVARCKLRAGVETYRAQVADLEHLVLCAGGHQEYL